jgi:hypothetical protein
MYKVNSLDVRAKLVWTCPESVDSHDEKIVFSKGRFTWE